MRVNLDEIIWTASHQSAYLRECMGVQKERKNQSNRLLTWPASLEMYHYPFIACFWIFSSPTDLVW